MYLNQKVFKSIKVKVDFNNEASIAEESKQEGAAEDGQQGGYGLSHLSGG